MSLEESSKEYLRVGVIMMMMMDSYTLAGLCLCGALLMYTARSIAQCSRFSRRPNTEYRPLLRFKTNVLVRMNDDYLRAESGIPDFKVNSMVALTVPRSGFHLDSILLL